MFAMREIQKRKRNVTKRDTQYRNNPKTAAEFFHRLGHAYHKTGNYKDAINSYRRAIQLNPGDYRAYMNLGDILYELGDINGAIRSFRKAIKLDPKEARFYIALSRALKEIGDLDGAIKAYNQAIELDPKINGNGKLRRELEKDVENPRKIEEDEKESLYDIDGASEGERFANQPIYDHEILKKLKDLRKLMIKAIEKLIKKDLVEDIVQDVSHIHICFRYEWGGDYVKGWEEMLKKRKGTFMFHLYELDELNPNAENRNVRIEFNKETVSEPEILHIRDSTGEVLEAVPPGEIGLAEPEGFTAYIKYGREYSLNKQKFDIAWAKSYFTNKMHIEGIEKFKNDIEGDPKNSKLYYELGKIHHRINAYTDAIRCLEKAIELDPKNPELHFSLGNVLFDGGDYQGAIRNYKKALRLLEGSVEEARKERIISLYDTETLSKFGQIADIRHKIYEAAKKQRSSDREQLRGLAREALEEYDAFLEKYLGKNFRQISSEQIDRMIDGELIPEAKKEFVRAATKDALTKRGISAIELDMVGIGKPMTADEIREFSRGVGHDLANPRDTGLFVGSFVIAKELMRVDKVLAGRRLKDVATGVYKSSKKSYEEGMKQKRKLFKTPPTKEEVPPGEIWKYREELIKNANEELTNALTTRKHGKSIEEIIKAGRKAGLDEATLERIESKYGEGARDIPRRSKIAIENANEELNNALRDRFTGRRHGESIEEIISTGEKLGLDEATLKQIEKSYSGGLVDGGEGTHWELMRDYVREVRPTNEQITEFMRREGYSDIEIASSLEYMERAYEKAEDASIERREKISEFKRTARRYVDNFDEKFNQEITKRLDEGKHINEAIDGAILEFKRRKEVIEEINKRLKTAKGEEKRVLKADKRVLKVGVMERLEKRFGVPKTTEIKIENQIKSLIDEAKKAQEERIRGEYKKVHGEEYQSLMEEVEKLELKEGKTAEVRQKLENMGVSVPKDASIEELISEARKKGIDESIIKGMETTKREIDTLRSVHEEEQKGLASFIYNMRIGIIEAKDLQFEYGQKRGKYTGKIWSDGRRNQNIRREFNKIRGEIRTDVEGELSKIEFKSDAERSAAVEHMTQTKLDRYMREVLGDYTFISAKDLAKLGFKEGKITYTPEELEYFGRMGITPDDVLYRFEAGQAALVRSRRYLDRGPAFERMPEKNKAEIMRRIGLSDAIEKDLPNLVKEFETAMLKENPKKYKEFKIRIEQGLNVKDFVSNPNFAYQIGTGGGKTAVILPLRDFLSSELLLTERRGISQFTHKQLLQAAYKGNKKVYEALGYKIATVESLENPMEVLKRVQENDFVYAIREINPFAELSSDRAMTNYEIYDKIYNTISSRGGTTVIDEAHEILPGAQYTVSIGGEGFEVIDKKFTAFGEITDESIQFFKKEANALMRTPLGGVEAADAVARAEKDLNKGIISEELKRKIYESEDQLSENAKLKEVKVGRWRITDEGKTYSIRKEDGELRIYKEIKERISMSNEADVMIERYARNEDGTYRLDDKGERIPIQPVYKSTYRERIRKFLQEKPEKWYLKRGLTRAQYAELREELIHGDIFNSKKESCNLLTDALAKRAWSLTEQHYAVDFGWGTRVIEGKTIKDVMPYMNSESQPGMYFGHPGDSVAKRIISARMEFEKINLELALENPLKKPYVLDDIKILSNRSVTTNMVKQIAHGMERGHKFILMSGTLGSKARALQLATGINTRITSDVMLKYMSKGEKAHWGKRIYATTKDKMLMLPKRELSKVLERDGVTLIMETEKAHENTVFESIKRAYDKQFGGNKDWALFIQNVEESTFDLYVKGKENPIKQISDSDVDAINEVLRKRNEKGEKTFFAISRKSKTGFDPKIPKGFEEWIVTGEGTTVETFDQAFSRVRGEYDWKSKEFIKNADGGNKYPDARVWYVTEEAGVITSEKLLEKFKSNVTEAAKEANSYVLHDSLVNVSSSNLTRAKELARGELRARLDKAENKYIEDVYLQSRLGDLGAKDFAEFMDLELDRTSRLLEEKCSKLLSDREFRAALKGDPRGAEIRRILEEGAGMREKLLKEMKGKLKVEYSKEGRKVPKSLYMAEDLSEWLRLVRENVMRDELSKYAKQSYSEKIDIVEMVNMVESSAEINRNVSRTSREISRINEKIEKLGLETGEVRETIERVRRSPGEIEELTKSIQKEKKYEDLKLLRERLRQYTEDVEHIRHYHTNLITEAQEGESETEKDSRFVLKDISNKTSKITETINTAIKQKNKKEIEVQGEILEDLSAYAIRYEARGIVAPIALAVALRKVAQSNRRYKAGKTEENYSELEKSLREFSETIKGRKERKAVVQFVNTIEEKRKSDIEAFSRVDKDIKKFNKDWGVSTKVPETLNFYVDRLGVGLVVSDFSKEAPLTEA